MDLQGHRGRQVQMVPTALMGQLVQRDRQVLQAPQDQVGQQALLVLPQDSVHQPQAQAQLQFLQADLQLLRSSHLLYLRGQRDRQDQRVQQALVDLVDQRVQMALTVRQDQQGRPDHRVRQGRMVAMVQQDPQDLRGLRQVLGHRLLQRDLLQ